MLEKRKLGEGGDDGVKEKVPLLTAFGVKDS